jgi:hypothetical protein
MTTYLPYLSASEEWMFQVFTSTRVMYKFLSVAKTPAAAEMFCNFSQL